MDTTITREPKVEFQVQQFGATVATIHETPDEAVEVVVCGNGRYRLVIHSRRRGSDRWDDLSAGLTAEQFEALGSVAKHMRGSHD